MMNGMLGKVGDIEVFRIQESYLLGETMQSWFPDFDREAIIPHETWLCPTHFDAESGHFSMPVSSWLLRIAGKHVLIDTCSGNHKSRPGFPEMHMLSTRYLDRLIACGVRPEEIDYVLCTHLHLDHVGWNTRLLDGRWVPTFTNAQYVFSRNEFEAAYREASAPDAAPVLKQIFEDSIDPIVSAGKACLVDGVHQLLDRLTLRPAPGHSPGHMRIELRSKGKTGVFSGDMLHSPVQVPFWHWSSRVCWDREMSANSRRELLEFCVSEGALLLPTHFEVPHVGRVKEDGTTFSIDFGW